MTTSAQSPVAPAPAATEDRPTSIRSLLMRGLAWTMFGHGVNIVLRLGNNIALAHLLSPPIFGVMAIVNVVMQGLAMFSDLGIGASIIQNRRGSDPVFVNTAWTIQIIRGTALWLFACALAWPTAYFYKEPSLIHLLPVAALSALIAGFYPTDYFTLNRRLDMKRITLLDLGMQLFSIIVMVGLAVVEKSPWPMVAGSIAAAMYRVVMGRWLLPHRDRLAWDASSRRELFSFGRILFFSTALLYLSNQGERVVLGKYLTLDALGVYSTAVGALGLATQFAQGTMTKLVFPTFALLFRERPARALEHYHRLGLLVVGLTFLMVVGIILCGPLAVRIMYDQRYHAAGWMLQILALQGGVDLLRANSGSLLLAAGKPGYNIWACGIRVVLLVTVLPFAFLTWGLHAAVWAIALSSIPPLLVFSYGVARTFPSLRRREVVLAVGVCTFATALLAILR